MVRTLAAWLLLGALALATAPAVAETQASSAEGYTYELWNGLMSPYCPGRTLIDCPSGAATELRNWIADQERAGRSQEEVEEQLYAQFGDVILQAPRAEGFGLIGYVAPVVALVLGGALVVVFLRRQTRAAAAAPAPPAPPALDPELERLVDQEMQ